MLMQRLQRLQVALERAVRGGEGGARGEQRGGGRRPHRHVNQEVRYGETFGGDVDFVAVCVALLGKRRECYLFGCYYLKFRKLIYISK